MNRALLHIQWTIAKKKRMKKRVDKLEISETELHGFIIGK